ncbi:chemotaxis protein CheB [Taibaiella soli]|uniref:protein-glutamate methylesterase n=1 Tax=Taibaiella soli TaxID=1649169 RepID=A0A2W2A6F4_9BACT|nr:chemotaxis protein CheB [Taibaiella soli]PZF70821.1 chemotaxis protein CheB [Taibaiella soli]
MEQNKITEVKSKLVIIGGSAGSLEVLLQILPHLHVDVPPIVVILHRRTDSESPLIDVLEMRTKLRVKEVEEKEPVKQGWIYVAPANYHVLFEHDQTFALDDSEKVNHSRPSIDVGFQSAAEVYRDGVTGILLSGANADGTEGFRKIQEHGGVTIAQNPETAEISYMPAQAIHHHTADRVADAEGIVAIINSL